MTKHKPLSRVDYIPFRAGRMVDLGGYAEGLTVAQAETEAKILMGFYHYDRVSIEHAGVIVSTVPK